MKKYPLLFQNFKPKVKNLFLRNNHKVPWLNKSENHPSYCSQSSDHPSKDVSPERKARR